LRPGLDALVRWPALLISHMCGAKRSEGFFWRSRGDVCAERCATRSERRRRSAHAIAGAASANISALEPGRSAPSSARRTSMFPVRSPITCAKLTVGRPCTGVFAPDAGPMCSANPKSGRHLSLCALERLTIRIWRRPQRPSGPDPRRNGHASTPLCLRLKDIRLR
jgi:hypothetical protein